MEVLLSNEQTECQIDSSKLESYIENILQTLRCSDKEVSILLVDDEKMRKLNKQYRGQDRATDVLSFPQYEEEPDPLNPHLLGDIVVSTTTANKQSAEHQLSLEEELVLLLIHGILHLLGYDHERSDEEAQRMKKKTRELFHLIFPKKEPAESCEF